jgi:hypothetical protein
MGLCWTVAIFTVFIARIGGGNIARSKARAMFDVHAILDEPEKAIVDLVNYLD